MLPREEAIVAVPEQTARVAQMAFPKGNVYIWMRDELGQNNSKFAHDRFKINTITCDRATD